MKLIYKLIIGALFIITLSLIGIADFTDESRYVGVRKTGDTGDSIIPISSPDALLVNISNYGMKEYTTVIIDNNTNVSTINFDGPLEHLIIEPNITTSTWRFKLVDPDGWTIYDGTSISQEGRLGLIVDLPLLGVTNLTIQNVSANTQFRIKIVYT